jgi:hypothetical protein
MMNAWNDIQKMLGHGEHVEAVVFGDYGWGGYSDPEAVPEDKKRIVLTWEEADKYMQGWTFFGSYGSPECYAAYIWSNKRVFWVTQYDGATNIDFMPRNPISCRPHMPGG